MNKPENPDIMNYLFARAGQNGIPLGGTFELTPLCNMNCRMCYIRMNEEQMKAKGRMKTVEEWLSLAEEAKQAGMLFLLITGGEPLLYPGFKELFIALKKMGIFVSINTNGTMINDDIVEFFKKYPPYRINITLYGGSDEAYKNLCRYENGYDKVIRAITKLKEAKLSVKINCSITPENMSDAETILGMAKDFSSPCSLGCYMFPPTRRDDKTTSRFSAEEAGRTQAKVDFLRYEKKDFDFNIRKIRAAQNSELKTDIPSRYRCRAGQSSFWVTWEGKMNACGMTEGFNLDPFEKGFAECWKEINSAIRDAEALKGCEGCKDREICKVCPAIAAAETGDINKKPEYVCRMIDVWKNEMLKIAENAK